MLAGFFREHNRTAHRFDDEVVRLVARKTEMNRRVNQCFEHEKSVRRSRATDCRRHVEIFFFVHEHLFAQCLKNRAGLLALLFAHLRRGSPDRHPRADLRGRVRHRAYDRVVTSSTGKCRDTSARENRNQQLIVAQISLQLRQNARQHLRLDAQHDDLARARGVPIVGGRVDVIARFDFRAAFLARLAHGDAVRRDRVAIEQTLDDRFAHHAAADK